MGLGAELGLVLGGDALHGARLPLAALNLDGVAQELLGDFLQRSATKLFEFP
jgi:hypothetical protein